MALASSPPSRAGTAEDPDLEDPPGDANPASIDIGSAWFYPNDEWSITVSGKTIGNLPESEVCQRTSPPNLRIRVNFNVYKPNGQPVIVAPSHVTSFVEIRTRCASVDAPNWTGIYGTCQGQCSAKETVVAESDLYVYVNDNVFETYIGRSRVGVPEGAAPNGYTIRDICVTTWTSQASGIADRAPDKGFGGAAFLGAPPSTSPAPSTGTAECPTPVTAGAGGGIDSSGEPAGSSPLSLLTQPATLIGAGAVAVLLGGGLGVAWIVKSRRSSPGPAPVPRAAAPRMEAAADPSLARLRELEEELSVSESERVDLSRLGRR